MSPDNANLPSVRLPAILALLAVACMSSSTLAVSAALPEFATQSDEQIRGVLADRITQSIKSRPARTSIGPKKRPMQQDAGGRESLAAQRRDAETRLLFSEAAREVSVLGFMIRYRSEEMKLQSRANQPLADAELLRLGSVIGRRVSGSRAMSGDSFAVTLELPITLAEGMPLQDILDSDPAIQYTSIDALMHPQLVPNDPYFPQQWSLANSPAGINAIQAWDVSTGSASAVIAVVDTGILPHPDLSGRFVPGLDFIVNSLSAGDGGGRDGDPTDTGSGRPANYCYTGQAAKASSWHGTHVAGTIAANGNNGTGVSGIDWRARIQPVRVLGRCGGATSDVVDGWRWAAGLTVPGVPTNMTPARVINMSLGGPTPCWRNPMEQAAAIEVLATGSAVIVAAGNEDDEAANYSPAGCYGVLTVGAVGPNGDRAPYSNYSSSYVIDISAPGGDTSKSGGGIISTVGSGSMWTADAMTYRSMQGTSMAAPHVSGVIGLMLGTNPTLTIAQIRDIVTLTTKAFPSGSYCATTDACGWGLLDANAAVSAARGVRGLTWNYQDHWYLPDESGWGIQVTAQGDRLFVTWYTYGSDGNPLWLVMVLERTSQDIFVGDVYKTTGKPLPNISGSRATISEAKVGSALLAFFGYDEGWLTVDIGSFNFTRPIVRLQFGSSTYCSYTYQARSSAANYQDMWWNPNESGWGLNLTHQGNNIFATWFTYGPTGEPLWLYMVADRVSANSYSGRFYQARGVPLAQMNFYPAFLSENDVGSGTLTFVNGEAMRFDYNVYGFSGSRPMQRQVFASPTTICEPM